jgi:hypothetical protein
MAKCPSLFEVVGAAGYRELLQRARFCPCRSCFSCEQSTTGDKFVLVVKSTSVVDWSLVGAALAANNHPLS